MQHVCAFRRSASEKARSPGQSYSLQQKTLLLHCLKCLVCSQAFTFVTYVYHWHPFGDIERSEGISDYNTYRKLAKMLTTLTAALMSIRPMQMFF